jgi:hypothetical protein
VLATSEGFVPRPRGTVAMNAFSFSGLPRKRSVLLVCALGKCDSSSWKYRKGKRRYGSHVQAGAHANDGTYTQHPNIIFRILDCQTLCRVDYGGLAGIVPDQARTRPDSGCGGDIDEDAAGALLLHLRHDLVDAVEDALDIDVHDEVEVLFCYVVVGLVAVGRASVVDDDVDFPVLVQCIFETRFPGVCFGNVRQVELACMSRSCQ